MSEIILARILKRVVVNEETGCWEWIGLRDKNGYGRIKLERKTRGVHRVFYSIMISDVPDEMLVCHHCDNPPCCNPEHLFLGTNQDNTADRHKKGRDASGDRHFSRTHPELLARGKKNGSAKLTDADVLEIRERYIPYRCSCPMLAAEFNVSKSAIFRIVKRKNWSHIT